MKKSGIKKIKAGLAVLNVTSYCNARCIFCSEGEHFDPKNIASNVIKKSVLRLKRQGVGEINFMGGEVTLRPDLPDLLKFIKRQGMRVQFVSNGIAYADNNFVREILASVDSLEISFHAYNRALFKKLMGVDLFDRQIEGIKNIKKNNRKIRKPIFFNFVTNSINLPHLVKTLKKIKEMMGGSCYFVHIKCLDIEGKVEKNLHLFPDFRVQKKYILAGVRYATRHSIPVLISRIPLCFYSGYEYLSLEFVLSHRDNELYFYNQKMLKSKTNFEPRSIITHGDLSSLKIPRCAPCSLKYYCPAVEGRVLNVLGAKNLDFLTPQNVFPKDVVDVMKKKSPFFLLDKHYHSYSAGLAPDKD